MINEGAYKGTNVTALKSELGGRMGLEAELRRQKKKLLCREEKHALAIRNGTQTEVYNTDEEVKLQGPVVSALERRIAEINKELLEHWGK